VTVGLGSRGLGRFRQRAHELRILERHIELRLLNLDDKPRVRARNRLLKGDLYAILCTIVAEVDLCRVQAERGSRKPQDAYQQPDSLSR
jgi:hypothetical protein